MLFAGPANDPDGIVSDASVYRDSRQALADESLSFADFLRRENLVLRSDLLRPWANWVTPRPSVTRRYDTYFFVGALPEGQRADGENTESDSAGWSTPQAAIDDFAAGRNFLLPPTWTQLDSLAGRAPSPTSSPWSVRSWRCSRTWRSRATIGVSSSSTPTATTRRARKAEPWGGRCDRLRERVRQRRGQ